MSLHFQLEPLNMSLQCHIFLPQGLLPLMGGGQDTIGCTPSPHGLCTPLLQLLLLPLQLLDPLLQVQTLGAGLGDWDNTL